MALFSFNEPEPDGGWIGRLITGRLGWLVIAAGLTALLTALAGIEGSTPLSQLWIAFVVLLPFAVILTRADVLKGWLSGFPAWVPGAVLIIAGLVCLGWAALHFLDPVTVGLWHGYPMARKWQYPTLVLGVALVYRGSTFFNRT